MDTVADAATDIVPRGSTWRHYKGGRAIALKIVENEETGEAMVVYHIEGHEERPKVRPLSEWLGWVPGVQGASVRRYRREG